MSTQVLITVEEYLNTSYRPDFDYVDGELQATNLGEILHARMQPAVCRWFEARRKDWNIEVLPQVRVQAAPTRFRVSDVSILHAQAEEEGIVRNPPIVVIEILSPEDLPPRYEKRLENLRRMGVRNIWVIDPQERRGYDCSSGEWVETRYFKATDAPIYMDLDQVFRDLE